MKKLLLLLLLSSLLTACNDTKQAAQNEILSYGISGTIDHLNPVLTEDGHSELVSLVYRGLMKPTEDNEVTGDLAKTVEVSDDQLTYTFTLNDAVWHDGVAVTAEDVVFTLETILDANSASPYYSDFQTINNMEAINDKQLVIYVTEPTPTLLHKLKVGILPKHIYEHVALHETDANRQVIGNGPYKLKSWQNDVLHFVANEEYYGKVPSIEEITVQTKLDENTKLLRLQKGQLHVAAITPQQKETVEAYNGIRVVTMPTADYRALQFNQQHEQLHDVKVRQAINYLLDREAIQEVVLKGTGEQAYGPLQRSFARYDAKSYQLDVKKAQALLKEAGYTKQDDYYSNGQPLSFEVVAPVTDPIRVAMATVIVEQLQKQGIDAQLQTKDWTAITIEQEDSFMIGWGSEADPDTHTYRVFHSSEHAPKGYNYALVANEKIDQALEAARVGSKEERTQAYIEFQQALEQEMAMSFLLYVDGIYAISNQITGISQRTLGHNGFGLMWNIEEWSWEDENA